jgi:hypothetical protein
VNEAEKRRDNVDTYAYFGEPVYTYSLKQGINDGFLTPFKVKQIATTLDDYLYTPDDKVIEGEIEEGKRYREPQFNRTIEIEERERYRVKLFMDQIDQREKALVFCATQGHALLVRDLINQMKTSSDPHYCERVTADDGERGEQSLRTFQDNEKTIPTILTTSQKLSTGVDARNIRNIVLMRPIGTMIEFKQIIGRGTRLFDGKDYFTIYDFVKAHEHFNDPEWDGEPMEPVEPAVREPSPKPDGMADEGDDFDHEPEQKPKKVKIKLADGKERSIQSMLATTFWSPDGRPISAAQFVEKLFGELPQFFKNEDELRRIWSRPDTRKVLLARLAEKGFAGEQLAEISRMINAEKSDLFDVLAYMLEAINSSRLFIECASAEGMCRDNLILPNEHPVGGGLRLNALFRARASLRLSLAQPDRLGSERPRRCPRAASTWGRLGLIVATAVGIQPNFAGTLTLELRNLGEAPLSLYPGQLIAQLFFHEVSGAEVGEGLGQYSGAVELLPRQLSPLRTHSKIQNLKKNP